MNDSSEVAEVTRVAPNESGVVSRYPAENTEATEVAEDQSAEKKRPSFGLITDSKINAPGLYYFDTKDDKPIDTRICSPLVVVSVTHDLNEQNFGKQVRYRNTVGNWKDWSMPMEMLKGSGEEFRGVLLSNGVEIAPGRSARELLATYLLSHRPRRIITCALQTGWCGNTFVLPDESIGEPNAKTVIFQSNTHENDYSTAGNANEWKAAIGRKAIGNPLLMLGLSTAFAGPLLDKCNAESGGINLHGPSSTGKSTIIDCSCSVWGGVDYKRSWRTTSNGLEGIAERRNDCLLALDEMGECSPKELAASVYAIGNGVGKQRASKTGSARPVTRWMCSVLSSSESTVETILVQAGITYKAGQSIRLLDVPVNRRFGAWDNLHDAANGSEFSDQLKTAAKEHHGHAGREFIRHLVNSKIDYSTRLEGIKKEICTEGQGQEKRAASRLSVIALAGELATEFGLTGWPSGEAVKSSKAVFEAWCSGRDAGNLEDAAAIKGVREYLDKYGDSTRFTDLDDASSITHHQGRSGYTKSGEQGVFYLLPDSMRDATGATSNTDLTRALDTLGRVSAVPDKDTTGKRSRNVRTKDGQKRLYPVTYSNLVTPDTSQPTREVTLQPAETLAATPVTLVAPDKSSLGPDVSGAAI